MPPATPRRSNQVVSVLDIGLPPPSSLNPAGTRLPPHRHPWQQGVSFPSVLGARCPATGAAATLPGCACPSHRSRRRPGRAWQSKGCSLLPDPGGGCSLLGCSRRNRGCSPGRGSTPAGLRRSMMMSCAASRQPMSVWRVTRSLASIVPAALSRNGYTMVSFRDFLRSAYSLQRPQATTPIGKNAGRKKLSLGSS
ncbi:hypothetical protein U9M48_020532 [Paspalum notatum var. saurae]|uniref:Uncharacterized protein n=1 Tax=Paspalum notatum var. saurae TaxID=547442 RepID=A0AAQ3WSS3_PASNO